MIINRFRAKFSKVYRDVANKVISYQIKTSITAYNDEKIKRDFNLHGAKSKNTIKPHYSKHSSLIVHKSSKKI